MNQSKINFWEITSEIDFELCAMQTFHHQFENNSIYRSNELGVAVESDFSPKYIVTEDKKKVVRELKSLAKKATTVWLASDEDREGEAIAWHLANTLDLNESN